ncbi:MAG: hypothetical protein AVDCRST_MAG02-4535 [uncultured Rubrobacteraceae bacterium]|uniref:GSCFA domain-containing protein n=1 Tax=uncultured Rubrobacteraceae bacterium TaxID=349277 RepID=A0A6J4S1C8_9ACTN|nr:MAG: hypothetical protein AVDCRST_MAG02-4535 [uncultured Rubrobacteraceae bacterium]
MKLDALEALKITRDNPNKRFPSEEDPRFGGDLLFPSLRPKFVLDAPAKVFTIGSCFARNIELALLDHDGIELPTSEFSVPKSEWEFRPNGLLNEYNPGTISQRILSAVGGGGDPEETIVEGKDGFIDLLLPGGSPVPFERAVARRQEIEVVYESLLSSDLVIVTLGLIEAWFDEETGLFLNRMPMRQDLKKQPERYSFYRLGVSDALPLLDRAFGGLVDAGVERVLLTVSPVPLGTTFSGEDVVVANSFSKAVLRVCAEELAQKYPQVDYFPSYEMVSSGGLGAFNPDNIHVRDAVVRRVTGHMLGAYFPNLAPDPGANGHASDGAGVAQRGA